MGYIKPTFNLVANNKSATVDAGPMSVALSLSTTPTADASGRLTVDVVEHRTIANVVHGSPVIVTGASNSSCLIDGSDFGTASSSSSGVVGCWVYIKNTTSSGNEVIYIGHTTDADHVEDDGGAYTELSTNDVNQRLFTLKAGEFAFFPYDYTGDLYVDASATGQSLEFWRFDR